MQSRRFDKGNKIVASKKHLLGLLFAVLTIIPMKAQTNIKNYNNTISGNGAPGLNLPCNIYNPGQLYDDQATGKVYGCTNGVWTPSASTLPAGGNYAIQFANNEALGGANFTGFVFNNGNSGPPTQATQGQAYSLIGGTPAFVALPNIFTASNTFNASNTFTVNNLFSGNNTFNASNTFSANNIFSGNNSFSGSNTFSFGNTSSANGAANQPAFTFSGTPFANGTSTTTKPLVLIEPAGLPSSGWDVKGTMLGINIPSTPTFAGQIVDFQINGVSTFRFASNGSLVSSGTATFNGIQANQSMTAGAYQWGVVSFGSNPTYNVPTTGVSVVLLDCSLFPITVNLPSSGPHGQEYVFKKVDGTANALTISGNGFTIDGAATQTITSQYGVLRITGLGGITPLAGWYLY